MALALPTVDELAEKISDELGLVQSAQEVAAQLESLGFTDDDARNVYGHADVFELAETVVGTREQRPDLLERAAAEEERRVRFEAEKDRPSKLIYIRHIIRGVAYGMPMGIMMFATIILLYGLWSYYYFEPGQATAIGVGTAMSYFVAGGFTQAIGRRGLMYLRLNLYLMTLKVSMFFIVAGAVVTALLAFVIIFVFSLVPVISVQEILLSVYYFVGLSVLWLCLAALYMLGKEILFTVAVSFGIGVVWLVREQFGAESMTFAHMSGVLAASAFSLVAAAFNLIRLHYKTREPGTKAYTKLPRISMLLTSTRTYLLYGTIYFTMLFADRLLAWTGRMDFRQTLIWFRADYEAGLNWALLGMLPAFTVLEIVLQRFGQEMKPRQLRHRLNERTRFAAWYMRFYVRQVVFYLVVAVLGSLGAYYGALALVPHIPELAVIEGPIPRFTFFFGVIGYLAIGFSLLNLAVFFWMSRARLAMVSLLPAMAANIVIGYLLSRVVSFHFAVFGLTVGALIFALVSTVLCLRVMANLDYYYYSAF